VRGEIFSLHTEDGEPIPSLAVAPKESGMDIGDEIQRALDLLPPIEATVVRHMQRIGDEFFLDPEEIACLLGVSVKDLQDIVKNAEEKLERILKAEAA
jgi:DNA-directed RNA polymerase specialized sigma24 family protein